MTLTRCAKPANIVRCTLDMQVVTCILSRRCPRHGRVFKALADPARRRLLDRLHADNGQTLGALCEHLDMSRQAVTQHLAVLEWRTWCALWHGREKLHYLNPVPLHEISERWIGKFERSRLRALQRSQKADWKETMMSKPQFVYVSTSRRRPNRSGKA